jgi:hypothetical protein
MAAGLGRLSSYSYNLSIDESQNVKYESKSFHGCREERFIFPYSQFCCLALFFGLYYFILNILSNVPIILLASIIT